MLKIITKNVQAKLEKIVSGKISCYYIKDMICIDVSNGRDVYKFTRWYTKEELSNGITSVEVVDEFLRAYTYHIRNKFFKI